MELLLRLYEGNKIKSETSIYQLEYTDEIRNQNSKGILVYKGLELNVLERNVNLNKKQVPFRAVKFSFRNLIYENGLPSNFSIYCWVYFVSSPLTLQFLYILPLLQLLFLSLKILLSLILSVN